MKDYWNTVWTVAQREVSAILATKGYWVTTVFAPLVIGVALYLFRGTLAQLPIDRWTENGVIEGSLGEAMLNEMDAVNVYRNWFWGHLSSSISTTKLERLNNQSNAKS